MAKHYFDETIDSHSEFGEEAKSPFSTMSAWDRNTLGDISPDAL
ncbi:gtp binding protein [Moniliophthora roreri]|nr:gtp binding protein [Moniliophthora roreri]